MPERIRFGPAGKPTVMKSGDYVKAIQVVAEMGLDALEYEAVRGVRVSEKKAVEIRRAAAEHGVVLSMHAPYFINFASPNAETVRKSQQRLLDAMKAAHWMGAYVVVFHPGYYKDNPSREAALRRTIENLKPVYEQLEQLGVKDVDLGPEVTGKRTQVGDVDEVIEICRAFERCRPVVDWAHLHARYRGEHVKTVDQVLGVIEKIERELGSRAVNPLHTHFSKIEYGEGGEREHHTLDEEGYGPDFRVVCQAYREAGIRAVIISESPILEQDALKMKRICCEEVGYC